jgi:NADPH:quinone reductase-like Zn-dependent oxidoreductase
VPRNGGVTDYVELALELGVPNDRIYTTINFPAIQKHSVKGQPNAPESSPEALAELVRLIGEGELEIPIAGVFALEDVQDAYKALAAGHTRGKIVLKP